MTGLLEGWEADYDGKRWFYRYKATGLVQYHFPQPGDEYAEFLFDAGTGPLQLTPEERLAIEQQSKRRSVPGSDSDTGNSTRTSGSRREKKKVEAIEEGGGMSATGYFDPSSFMYPPGAYNNISPVEDEDGDENTFGKKRSQDTPNTALGITPEATPTENLHTSHLGVAGHGVQRTNKLTGNAHQQAVELPEGGQQIWSPVGYVAELATQDTVKCAEELAPVELDATSSILVPIRTNTNIAQGLAELPTHKTPVEETAPDMPLIQPVVQSVDAYPLVSASFAYPPLKTNINPVVNASSGIVSTGETVSPGKNAVAIGESKYQPFKPTSNTIEQTLQEHNNTTESLPQTSVLQNQNNELGHLGQNNSGHAELSMAGDIPSTLAPPLAQSKPAPTKTSSSVDSQTPSIPSALQPAQKPAKQSASLEITNQLPQAGVQANSVSVPGHNLPHHSSMLTPGGTKPNNHFPESEGNLKFRPPQLSAQNTPGNVNSSRPSEQIMHASSSHIGHPSVPRINTPPDKVASGSSSPPKPNSGPGFLLFHEITSTPNASDYGTSVHPGESAKPAVTPHNPNSGHIHSQPSISANQGGPVVAPLNLHSSASSWVSSINPQKQDSKPDLGKPALIPSDKMSEVHSGTGSFMPQLTPPPSSQTSKPPNHQILAESNKPSHTAMGGGVNGLAATSASARPQSIYQLSSSPATGLQQGPAQTTLAMANMFKPGLVMVNPATQPNTTSSPSNVGTTTTQSQPYMQATHRPPLPVQGLSNHSQKPPQLLPFQTGNPGQVTPSPGPPNPQGNVSSTPIPQTPAAIASGRPPAQVTQAHSHAAHQPAAQNNPVQNVNNTSQQQASMPIPNMTGPVPLPTTQSAHPSYHQPYGQGNAPQSQFRPPTVGSQQAPTHNPNIQRPPTAGLPSQQPPAQPSAGYQALGSPTGQIPPKPPNQQPSPATQSVSPIQSQVSSPAQSIASLHISQASTPSNTFATVNSPTSAHGGSNTNTNQYTNGPVRPSSASAYTSAQQGGNIKPNHSHPMSQQPAGAVHNQSPSTINSPPPKPFPMLPGQVTPLPSQLGSAPVPSPLQQSVLNSPAKPAFNAQQTTRDNILSRDTLSRDILKRGIPKRGILSQQILSWYTIQLELNHLADPPLSRTLQ
ncbi:hypothetical protein F4802DRAFT_322451 [Xylaria palmicola]|nr:hypothetical protein F4802DRAFT_322451 [Xylaria palmicola]